MSNQLPVLLALEVGLPLILNIARVAIPLLAMAGMWGIFVKAGKPDWAGIILTYN
jgi:hypothetical protein